MQALCSIPPEEVKDATKPNMEARMLFTSPNTFTEFEQYRAKQLAAPFSSLSSSVHYKSLPFHDTRNRARERLIF